MLYSFDSPIVNAPKHPSLAPAYPIKLYRVTLLRLEYLSANKLKESKYWLNVYLEVI